MWIVRLALRRPYTFAVLALLLMILGPLAIMTMPVDIFPNIDIPVVAMIWQYTGFSPQQMADRLVTLSERSLTTTVNDIEHVESMSVNGRSIIKIYFQPGVNIGEAVAQVTAIAQTQIKQMPAGTTPPLIIQYNASSVPIIQLGLSGQGLTEAQLNDYGLETIRTQLVTVPGAGVPYPYGGRQRQVQVDLNIPALQAKGLSPADVVNTIGAQNLILPSGTIKVGPFEYQLETNAAPLEVEELNNLPIRQVNGAMVYIRDVAHVEMGSPPQTNIVRVDGQRASLLSVIKTGNASTLDIIKGVLAKVQGMKGQLPPQLKITPLSDQSIFVKASVDGVVHEAIIAACLTAVMILIFLGSWRSTVIIAVSIPLSILTSLLVLRALGETINIMTLGGLALAVGILVDDATVEIENINRNLEQGKAIEQAILDGAAQIAVPALVATISICIVFVPMFFLGGVARYLFVPLAEAVVFAMLASYLLSRTVVPTMARYLLHEHDPEEGERKLQSRNPLIGFQLGFEHWFEKIRRGYRSILELCIEHAALFMILFFVFTMGSAAVLYPFLGEDFFPTVDSGQFKLHVRARTGTRIEDMAALCDRIDNTIREAIPKKELVTIIDNIGLPYSGINTTYSNSAPIGPADADIQVSLTEQHRPTNEYVAKLQEELPQKFPGIEFYALPVDMVTQILNFGLPAPIDVQIVGPDLEGNRLVANRLLNEIKYVPGTAGLRIQQPFDNPKLTINVNRSLAESTNLQERDVAQSLLVASSGSFQTSPTFYLDPRNGVEYDIVAQSEQYDLDTLQDLRNIPVTTGSGEGGAPPNRASYGAGLPPGGGGPGGGTAGPDPGQCGVGGAGGRDGHGDALQHHAGTGYIRQCGGDGSGQCEPEDPDHRGSGKAAFAAGVSAGDPGAGTDDDHGLQRTFGRAAGVDPAGLFTDRDQFPVVAGSVHYCDGAAGGGIRDCVVSVSDAYAAERSGADRRNYVYGGGDLELDSGGEFCAGAAGGDGGRRSAVGAERGIRAVPAGADDGAGDDHRDGADVAGTGIGRRAERAAGTGGDRGPAVRHGLDVVLCADGIQRDARTAGAAAAGTRGEATRTSRHGGE
jgi:multidrug efflux pump subunit AcrB